jgi:hypothetical protein
MDCDARVAIFFVEPIECSGAAFKLALTLLARGLLMALIPDDKVRTDRSGQ